MGHITSSLGLRIGGARKWVFLLLNSKDSFFGFRFYIHRYFENVFADNFFRDRGFIFSHYSFTMNRFGFVTVYLYDGAMEAYKLSFLRKYRLLMRLKRIRRSSSSVSLVKYKDLTFYDLRDGRLFVLRKNYFSKLRYFFYRVFFLSLVRDRFYRVLSFILLRDICRLFGFEMKAIIFKHLEEKFLTANILAKLIVRRLQQRANLNEVVYGLIRRLKRYVLGLRIRCSGRFSRAQRAKSLQEHIGRISLNTFYAPIDYHFRKVRLKYGACGVKVWIHNNMKAH